MKRYYFEYKRIRSIVLSFVIGIYILIILLIFISNIILIKKDKIIVNANDFLAFPVLVKYGSTKILGEDSKLFIYISRELPAGDHVPDRCQAREGGMACKIDSVFHDVVINKKIRDIIVTAKKSDIKIEYSSKK